MKRYVIFCALVFSVVVGYLCAQSRPSEPSMRGEKGDPEIKVFVTMNTPSKYLHYSYLTYWEKTLWVGGSYLWCSNDQGKEWKEVSVTTVNDHVLHRLGFMDAKRGWDYVQRMGVGKDADILFRTQDGGVTWDKVDLTIVSNSRPPYFDDVRFTSSDTGIAKGSDGRLYLSTDGGKEWKMSLPGNFVHDFFFVNNDVGWIIADHRGFNTEAIERWLMKTEDGGRTWKQATAPPFVDDTVIEKSIRKTPPDLNGWFGRRSVRFTDQDHGWIFGDHGDVYRTDDGGKTWKTATPLCDWQKAGENDVVIRNGSFVDDKIGYLVGEKGRMFKTTDAGQTWKELQSGTQDCLLDVYFSNAMEGWCVRTDAVMKTIDGGEHWTIMTPGSEEEIARQKRVDEIKAKVKRHAPSGSEIIRGEIVDKGSGKGIAGIVVELVLISGSKEKDASYTVMYIWRQTTDESGKYAFVNLPEVHRVKTTKSIILGTNSLTKEELMQTVGQRYALGYRGIPQGMANERIVRGEGVELVKGDPITLKHELIKTNK